MAEVCFLTGVPIMAAAFVLAWFVPVVALRTGNDQKPDATDNAAELLESDADKAVMREVMTALYARFDAQNRVDNAKAEQALKANGKYGPAIMGMAEVLKAQGKKAKALEYYQRYLDEHPNGSEANVAKNAIERLK